MARQGIFNISPDHYLSTETRIYSEMRVLKELNQFSKSTNYGKIIITIKQMLFAYLSDFVWDQVINYTFVCTKI